MHRSVRVAPLVTLFVASLLIGCNAEGERARPASQVVVKVNKDEISVHQLNELLARAGDVPADQLEQASSAALERLIDRELMVQQARDRKLDRDPKIMQAIETARRDILANAYAEQIAGMGPRPTDAQVSTFYAEHPGLFSSRRVYSLQELNIRVSAARYEEVRERIHAATELGEVASWLGEEGIPFSANTAIKPAEQLPIEMLDGLLRLEPGQLAISRTPDGVLLLRIVSFRDEPIDQETARPFIEQYLNSMEKSEMAQAEVKRLRAIAAIEYVGDFKPGVDPEPDVKHAAAVETVIPPADGARAAIEKGALSLIK